MNLPAIREAKLPANYLAAKTALEKCSTVDECEAWKDKASALASYALQSKDAALQKMAERIRARAIRRCGELYRQIKPTPGDRTDLKPGGLGSPRSQAARSARLSKDEIKTALRVANIPKAQFEEMVESDKPPSTKKLADMGRLRDGAHQVPPGFVEATRALGNLQRFAEFCRTHDPKIVSGGLRENEKPKARKWVAEIDRWLDVFITHIQEGE